MVEEMKIVGTNVQRVDALAKATGSARFTVDVQLPNMAYVKFLRSPHAHARVRSVDLSGLNELDGVVAVITPQELKGIILHGDVLDDHVRFLGEAVVGVLCETEDEAESALEHIRIDYEPLPAVLDYEEALKPEAATIWQEGNVCTWHGYQSPKKGSSLLWEKGDVDEAFTSAYAVAETEMRAHAQFHGCLEPHACVASWDAGLGEMTIWISTQGIYDDQKNIARALNIPVSRVRVLASYVGGGFGSKAHNTCKEYVMSALLSRKASRPVRYVPTRSEEIIAAMRHPSKFSYKVASNKEGLITAVSMTAFRSGGAHTSLQMNFLMGSTDYVAPVYVKSPNVRYEGWSTYTTLPLCAAFRGFGYFESGMALAQALDMLCEKLHMDPVEFLLKNAPQRGDPVGADQGPLTTAGVRETIRLCAEQAGWKEKWHEPGTMRLPDGRYHGIAIAHAMGRASMPDYVTSGNAMIQVNCDGTARLLAGVSDMGQGQATGLRQIAAEALGLRYEDVTITWGDTSAPHTGYQVASSSTMQTGNPTRLAALDARRQILEYAAQQLNVKPEDLDIKDSVVFVKDDTSRFITVRDVVGKPGIDVIVGNGRWTLSDKHASPRSLCVTVAEVAVDPGTGRVEVLHMVQGTDCGKALSRSRVEGQLEGVLSGGVGYVLFEDWSMDKGRGGRILNLNMSDYHMPTFLDTSGILDAHIILEDEDPQGPFGARGMGEAVLSACAPAIINAVYNAIGIRFTQTPLSPNKVLEALHSASPLPCRK